MAGSFSNRCAMRRWRPSPHHPDELVAPESTRGGEIVGSRWSARPETLEPALQGGSTMGVALEVEVAGAEGREQGVVEAAHRARWVLVAHPLDEGGAVDGGDHLGEGLDRRDAELEEQARDPRVVVGARPARVGVLRREERGEVRRADPGVLFRGVRWAG